MRGLAATFAIVAGLLPLRSWAASCCGGAAIAEAFVLLKSEEKTTGIVAAFERTVDVRDEGGQRLHTNWRVSEFRLIPGFAYRVHPNAQLSAVLPLVTRKVNADVSEHGWGVGDVNLAARYEFLDEKTCFAQPLERLRWDELKPSIHAVVKLYLPTGLPPGFSSQPLGSDITGRGLWAAEVGPEVTKIWGRWGNTLSFSGGRQWPRTQRTGAPTAWRWQAGTGVSYFWEYQRSLAFWVAWREEHGMNLRTRAEALSLQANYFHPRSGLRLKAGLGETALITGGATPISWLAFTSITHAF